MPLVKLREYPIGETVRTYRLAVDKEQELESILIAKLKEVLPDVILFTVQVKVEFVAEASRIQEERVYTISINPISKPTTPKFEDVELTAKDLDVVTKTPDDLFKEKP